MYPYPLYICELYCSLYSQSSKYNTYSLRFYTVPLQKHVLPSMVCTVYSKTKYKIIQVAMLGLFTFPRPPWPSPPSKLSSTGTPKGSEPAAAATRFIITADLLLPHANSSCCWELANALEKTNACFPPGKGPCLRNQLVAILGRT